jgi:hypothetical protein
MRQCNTAEVMNLAFTDSFLNRSLSCFCCGSLKSASARNFLKNCQGLEICLLFILLDFMAIGRPLAVIWLIITVRNTDV